MALIKYERVPIKEQLNALWKVLPGSMLIAVGLGMVAGKSSFVETSSLTVTIGAMMLGYGMVLVDRAKSRNRAKE